MSYSDIVKFTRNLKELEESYESKEKTDEKLGEIIEMYNKICLERRNVSSLPKLLKEKLVQVVMANEDKEKADSLEASLQ